MTCDNKAKGLYDKRDFVYIEADNEYRCPAGRAASLSPLLAGGRDENKSLLHDSLPPCALKAQCTTGKERRVRRWEHEGVLDAMQDRLDQHAGEDETTTLYRRLE